LITCDQGARPARPGISNFVPLGVFHLPEYHDQKLFHPPLLDIVKFCYEQNFIHIKAATPGPMGLTALACARLLKLPIWGTYHTALPQFAQFLTEDSTVVAWMWKYILWFYSQMDVIFAPSQSTAAELIDSGIEPRKIRVYPRGVDLERFHPDKRNGFLENRFGLQPGVKLLYVGRVSKEKNLEMLGRVFKEISRNRDSMHLVVVGDGPYLKDMQRELAGSPVTFTGYLEGEDLAAVYASCDLFIFPSTTDTFGNVVLEAQASGIPVIVSNTGGPQENIIPEKTGLIVPGDKEEELALTIVDLASHPERLQMMGQAARAYVESRSFEDAFKASWEMYLEISLAGEPREGSH
jgi:glycosyltransferase involved in cell wall biosynthesis